jgi:hypothetical protein
MTMMTGKAKSDITDAEVEAVKVEAPSDIAESGEDE